MRPTQCMTCNDPIEQPAGGGVRLFCSRACVDGRPKKPRQRPMVVVCRPSDLCDLSADAAAKSTSLTRTRGEAPHAFVQRIVCAYMNAVASTHSKAVEAPRGLQ